MKNSSVVWACRAAPLPGSARTVETEKKSPGGIAGATVAMVLAPLPW
jgi:hypothetical protein